MSIYKLFEFCNLCRLNGGNCTLKDLKEWAKQEIA